MRRRSVLIMITAALTLGAACTTSEGAESPSPAASGPAFNAEVASVDLYTAATQRFLIGLFAGDANGVRYLTFGDVELRFAFLGDGTAPPTGGTTTTGVYVPTPGTEAEDAEPTLSEPSVARGVYQAEDVTFDEAGTWQVTVRADVTDVGPVELTTAFVVSAEPALPAPGQRALKTENLTLASKDEPPAAIDSHAADGGAIPDPSLHRWTIAEAIRQQRPALVSFATPVYCESRFCGPVVDAVEQLSKRYADDAVFIHVEIFHDFANNEINEAAADWLYRNGDLREPWLYLIGADGTIVDRWGVLWDPQEVGAELRALSGSAS
jgi:hypothetical protein